MPRDRLAEQLQDKKILITGGNGFLGRYLFPRIRQLCMQASLYKGDIREIGNFREHYDIVCHLAAINKIDPNSGPGLLFDSNVNGTLAVMRYCLRAEAKCVLASSSAVYRPMNRKKMISENSCAGPVSLYGVSKMLAENICKYHAEDLGVPVISLRIFNMYGPEQERPFLIPDVMHQLSKNKPVSLRSPMAVRDFVYISDVVNAFILSCALRSRGFLALNVGSAKGSSVCRIARRLALKKGLRFRMDKGDKSDFARTYMIADIRNAATILKWKPEISLSEGLLRVVESFKPC